MLWLLSVNWRRCLLSMQSVKYLSNHLFVIFYLRFRGFACSFGDRFLWWLYWSLLFNRWMFIIFDWLHFCALGNLFGFTFFNLCLIGISWSIGINLRFIFFRSKRNWLFDNRRSFRILRRFFGFIIFKLIQDKILCMKFDIVMFFCLWNIFLAVSFINSFRNGLKVFF